MKFQKEEFLEYVKDNFNLDDFSMQLINSIIEYGEKHQDTTKRQIVYFIYDVLVNVECFLDFEDINQFYK